MKKVLCAMLMVWSTAYAQPTALNATSALVIDADTHETLFRKNDDEVRSIASITKMMTALVTVEAQLPLDELITITDDDVEATRLRHMQTGTSLTVGQTLTRGELLHLALMNSQNRAAAALGRTYPGGMAVFIEAMNATADRIGMLHTTFVDPTGLYNDNRSTANDLAILISRASEHQIIRDFSTSTSFQMTSYYRKRNRVIGFGSTNRLVTSGKWNVLVQKTGYIQAAGHCVVMMTSLAARRVIIVLLNTTDNQKRAVDAIKLMHWVEHGEVATSSELAAQNPYNKHISKRKRR